MDLRIRKYNLIKTIVETKNEDFIKSLEELTVQLSVLNPKNMPKSDYVGKKKSDRNSPSDVDEKIWQVKTRL